MTRDQYTRLTFRSRISRKWMCPPEAKVGETFNIWVGSGLLEAKFRGSGNYSAGWRKAQTREPRPY